jgi:hypothetical protein
MPHGSYTFLRSVARFGGIKSTVGEPAALIQINQPKPQRFHRNLLYLANF